MTENAASGQAPDGLRELFVAALRDGLVAPLSRYHPPPPTRRRRGHPAARRLAQAPPSSPLEGDHGVNIPPGMVIGEDPDDDAASGAHKQRGINTGHPADARSSFLNRHRINTVLALE